MVPKWLNPVAPLRRYSAPKIAVFFFRPFKVTFCHRSCTSFFYPTRRRFSMKTLCKRTGQKTHKPNMWLLKKTMFWSFFFHVISRVLPLTIQIFDNSRIFGPFRIFEIIRIHCFRSEYEYNISIIRVIFEILEYLHTLTFYIENL